MKEREMFQKTFSHLRASPEILTEVLKMTEAGNQKLCTRRAARRIATLALAAALLLALGVTAYAVGRSIHQARQEELRQEYAVEENQVNAYVEFNAPETAEPGITLLSTITDGQVQRIYVNVSPVAPEEIRSPWLYQDVQEDGRTHYLAYEYTVNGEHRNYAAIHTAGDWAYAPEDYVTYTDAYGNEQTVLTDEAKYKRFYAQAYDPETQTLTLECFFWAEDVPDDQPVELHLYSTDNWATADEDKNLSMDPAAEIHRDFGTVLVPLAEPELRTVYFAEPVEFENPMTQGKGWILGAELSATGLTWLAEQEDLESAYDPNAADDDERALELYRIDFAWLQAMDAAVADAALELADGSRVLCPGINALEKEELSVRLYTSWLGGGTVNLRQIVSITVGGLSFPVQ